MAPPPRALAPTTQHQLKARSLQVALEPPRSRTPPGELRLPGQDNPTDPSQSMKIAIMQPYLFPYIGYFQLISAADRFVIHDDVQSIKGGWINRNRILVGGEPHYITL